MPKLIYILLLTSSTRLFCQSPQSQINEQVWRPFIKSYNDLNATNFLAVHSKDVIRSPREARQVLNWNEYFASQSAGDKREQLANNKRSLTLRFTERLSRADHAVEVGIFEVVYQLPNGQTEKYYGRFHVVLRKEKGQWKILVDTDSTEGGKIGERDFLDAKPMEP